MKYFTEIQKNLLGLSKEEGQILDLLSESGPLNTSIIADSVRIPRITTRRILMGLHGRGFVYRREERRGVIWAAKGLNKVRESMSAAFGLSVLGSMEPISLSEVGDLTLYRGEREMYASNMKLLSLSAGERVLTVEPNGIWKHFAKAPADEWQSLNKLVKEKNIILEVIVEEGFERELGTHVAPKVSETFLALSHDLRVVPSGMLDSATEVIIFRDVVLFLDWAHWIGVEIKNPSTVRVVRAMYRLLQSSGRSVSNKTRT